MLSPTINGTQGQLTKAFNEILLLDGYAQSAQSTFIGKLAKDPDWLQSVRSRIALLSNAGAAWISARPGIWSSVLVPFEDYATLFGAVAAKQPQLTTGDEWLVLLRPLAVQIRSCAAQTTAAGAALTERYNAFKSVQPLLADSINQGWAELAEEEQQMVKIASQLTHLQDVVASLQDSITGTEISTGKSVVQSTVTMLYNVATVAGGSFSFLSMAGAAFTVGKTFYDIIKGIDEIDDTLRQIAELQLEASEEAQAAAGTKMVLQLLYNLELSFARINDVVPQMAAMWTAEQGKLEAVIEALESGADPSTYFELVSFSVANANWQAIRKFVLQLVNAQQTVSGPPVTLNPQQPITAAA